MQPREGGCIRHDHDPERDIGIVEIRIKEVVFEGRIDRAVGELSRCDYACLTVERNDLFHGRAHICGGFLDFGHQGKSSRIYRCSPSRPLRQIG